MIDAPDGPLFRGFTEPVRNAAAEGDGTTLAGHFSAFDAWYEIDSWYEGRFLERTAVGAFRKTIKENRENVVVQYDHGYDMHVGDALLGPIDVLREEDFGPYYEVPLLDTDYNRDRILPMLSTILMSGENRGTSLLGSSFRFRVTRDEWVKEPKKSDHNPDGLPERTIREVRLFEFGPVVFPANPSATAGVRSVGLTDHYLDRTRELRSSRSLRSPAGPATGDLPDTPLIGAPPATHPPFRSLSSELEFQYTMERALR